MTTWLIHGFNVFDGGKDTIGRLAQWLPGPVRTFDYGWTGPLTLRCTNRNAVEYLAKRIKPGDILVAHSNGALICWRLAEILGDHIGAIVVINPALRRDTTWNKNVPVLCLANSTDWVVQLGRWWSRLVSFGGLHPHGWGAAGRYGFTRNQKNVHTWDTADGHWTHPVRGHSGVFKPRIVARYWGLLVKRWLISVAASGLSD